MNTAKFLNDTQFNINIKHTFKRQRLTSSIEYLENKFTARIQNIQAHKTNGKVLSVDSFGNLLRN